MQVIDEKGDCKPGKSESWESHPSSKERESDQEAARRGAKVPPKGLRTESSGRVFTWPVPTTPHTSHPIPLPTVILVLEVFTGHVVDAGHTLGFHCCPHHCAAVRLWASLPHRPLLNLSVILCEIGKPMHRADSLSE